MNLVTRDRIYLGLVGLLPLLVWGLGWLRSPVFMSDDFIFIVDNEATWISAWAQDSYRAAGFEGAPPVVYRPVGVALLATLKVLLGVTSPTPYRVLAVVLHATNAMLLALWLRGLGLPQRRALVAAALWSLMPIHAESLYWASALFDLMASTALLAALLLATKAGLASRLGAVALWFLALLLKETTLFGAAALLFTMAFCAPSVNETDGPEANPPLGVPAVVGALALAAWWTVRSMAGVRSPQSVPLDWSALAASFGEAVLRAVGLGESFRAGGPPLHGVSAVSGVVLLFTGWYAWRASRRYPRVTLCVLSLSLIGAAQVLFGQSETGFLVDPDRYFYLTSACIPAIAVCAWQPSGQASSGVTIMALASIGFLLVAWSWSAISARASYDDFEAMLTREIRIGRASGYVYFLRGVERLKREDPCAAEMDFRASLALEKSPAKRAQAKELGLRALGLCNAPPTDAVPAEPDRAR